jgi:hypothetical protein
LLLLLLLLLLLVDLRRDLRDERFTTSSAW